MDLGGGQNKHQMGRRLLQDLKKGIEGLGGKHMDLVHDVDPLFDRGGGVNRVVQDRPDVVHPVVGGGVQLHHVQDGAVFDSQAGGALVAGVSVHRMLTVHRPGQQLGTGCLSGAPGTGKEVGVGEPSLLDLPLQSLGNMVLVHHIVEGAGTPFTVKGLIHTFTSR